MNDAKRHLYLVPPVPATRDPAGEPGEWVDGRSPEQRERMRRSFLAALAEMERKDLRRRPSRWKKPAWICASLGVVAIAAVWHWLAPVAAPLARRIQLRPEMMTFALDRGLSPRADQSAAPPATSTTASPRP